MLIHLGDVDDVQPLLPRGEGGGHPVHHHIRAAAGQHLVRVHIRPAGLDGDVQPVGFVKALGRGDVIAGELRLRDPFELQGDGVIRLRGGENSQCRDGSQKKSFHEALLFK